MSRRPVSPPDGVGLKTQWLLTLGSEQSGFPSHRSSHLGGEATVSTPSVLGWFACVTSQLLPSQSRTLAAPVTAVCLEQRAEMGQPTGGQGPGILIVADREF